MRCMCSGEMGRAGCGGECSAAKREVRELGPVELVSASVDAESGNWSCSMPCRSTVDGSSGDDNELQELDVR